MQDFYCSNYQHFFQIFDEFSNEIFVKIFCNLNVFLTKNTYINQITIFNHFHAFNCEINRKENKQLIIIINDVFQYKIQGL